MDSQVRGKTNHGFSSKNSQKKIKGQRKSDQVCKPLSRDNLKKNSNLLSQANYNAQRNFNAQPAWSIFSSGNDKPKHSVYNHRDSAKGDNQPFYGKGDNRSYNRGYYSDMPRYNNYNCSTSDSDSNSNQFSELSGFKIVSNGEIIHDDTYEDIEQRFDDDEDAVFGLALPSSKDKFASSEMTMMPNFKAISIPMFLQA